MDMFKKLVQNRWYIYQKERFPILMYIPMILAFSFSAVSYSSIVRDGKIAAGSVVVAFITTFSTFMLLRIADEFKDYEEDLRFRPYRPVQRGLVKLKELGIIGGVLLLIQAVSAALLKPVMLLFLLPVWVYYFAMTKEFFVSEWLKKHLVIYMLSHLFVMPLLDFYAAATDFAFNDRLDVAPAVLWFVSSSFVNGGIVEIGRKMRAPEDEEAGVNTYSVLWGRKKSAIIWTGAMVVSTVFTCIAASQIGETLPSLIILSATVIFCGSFAALYVKKPTTKNAKRLELLSGVWTIVDYCVLGILPLVFRTIK